MTKSTSKLEFRELSTDAFKRVLSNPKKYGVDIRPLKDCVHKDKEWREMSKLILLISYEYKHSIPLPILTEIFYDTFSDISVMDSRGEIMCKLRYSPIPDKTNIFGGTEKIS